MSKEKFNWKSLFINEEEASEESPSGKKETISVPSDASKENIKTVTKFPDHKPQGVKVETNTLNKIIEMYESGFDSLNKPGYDFYEFFKAIKAVGSNEPQIYKMALSMAQGVDKSVKKETLLSEANFYINEIEKVFSQYEQQGNSKKIQVQESLKNKKASLNNEIATLEKKLMELQNQLSNKKNDLLSIDSSLVSDVAEIDQKLIANKQAKTKILETIMGVVDGIKNNL